VLIWLWLSPECPDALWETVSRLGRTFVSDDEVAGVEIDAKVRHVCRILLDPINGRVLEADAIEVLGAELEGDVSQVAAAE
jgi:hypothetical protein